MLIRMAKLLDVHNIGNGKGSSLGFGNSENTQASGPSSTDLDVMNPEAVGFDSIED